MFGARDASLTELLALLGLAQNIELDAYCVRSSIQRYAEGVYNPHNGGEAGVSHLPMFDLRQQCVTDASALFKLPQRPTLAFTGDGYQFAYGHSAPGPSVSDAKASIPSLLHAPFRLVTHFSESFCYMFRPSIKPSLVTVQLADDLFRFEKIAFCVRLRFCHFRPLSGIV